MAARAVLLKTCRSARCHCERAAEHFEREGKYGLNCQGEAMRRSPLFVDPDVVAEGTGTSHQTEGPAMVATEE